jgi:hypothetical protein
LIMTSINKFNYVTPECDPAIAGIRDVDFAGTLFTFFGQQIATFNNMYGGPIAMVLLPKLTPAQGKGIAAVARMEGRESGSRRDTPTTQRYSVAQPTLLAFKPRSLDEVERALEVEKLRGKPALAVERGAWFGISDDGQNAVTLRSITESTGFAANLLTPHDIKYVNGYVNDVIVPAARAITDYVSATYPTPITSATPACLVESIVAVKEV